MDRRDEVAHFRKVYPTCSNGDVLNLIQAIRNDKYWNALPGRDDAIYVVALTRARIPIDNDFQGRATHLGRVRVLRNAARFCRKGRVIGMVRIGGRFVGRLVLTWPAFLLMIREAPEFGCELLLKNDAPAFLDERETRRMVKAGVIRE